MTLRIRDRTYWTDGVSDPHSLLGRSKLNELITGFRLSGKQKAEMRHVVVWGFHLRRAHQDYAWTSLASERFMVADLRGAFDGRWGLARQHIRKAHDDLVAWGFLAVAHKGRGKGDASRYWPNFDLLHQAAAGRFPYAISVTIPADVIAMFGCDIGTGNHVVSTSKPGTTSCPVVGTTSYPVEGGTGNHVVSEDLITGPGERPESSKVGVSAAAGTPAADAPGAATGFERIWNAYGKLGNKQESRKAFATICSPDINHIAERAASWAASAKPGQKRMPLEKWLAAERYDEADRQTLAPAAPRTSTSKAKEPKPKPQPQMPGQNYRIFDAVIESDEFGNETLKIALEGETGTAERSFSIIIQHRDSGRQVAGQHRLTSLLTACGITTIDGPGELLGHSIYMDGDGKVSPSRPAAVACNDNEPLGEAA